MLSTRHGETVRRLTDILDGVQGLVAAEAARMSLEEEVNQSVSRAVALAEEQRGPPRAGRGRRGRQPGPDAACGPLESRSTATVIYIRAATGRGFLAFYRARSQRLTLAASARQMQDQTAPDPSRRVRPVISKPAVSRRAGDAVRSAVRTRLRLPPRSEPAQGPLSSFRLAQRHFTLTAFSRINGCAGRHRAVPGSGRHPGRARGQPGGRPDRPG